jgi:hypothetical protein
MEIKNYYRKNSLLSSKGNTKIDKNDIPTYNLSLLPHSLNTKKVNLCTFSTKECRDLCLNTTGRGKFNSVQSARLKKTDFYIEHKKTFLSLLALELSRINLRFPEALIRLNTFSDIDWEKELNLIDFSTEDFSNLIFYNYTKNPNYILNKTKNQEFTFSFSGYNWNKCEEFLNKKQCNVAVVFDGNKPKIYKGFNVLDGDITDMRLEKYDGLGNVIALRLKGNNKNFKNFVVKTT